MNAISLPLRYATRLIRREWRRFVLPTLSLIITTVVLLLILLLTESGALLLDSQARELQGGDVVIESTAPVAVADIYAEAGIIPTKYSESVTFNATLGSSNATAPFEVEAVDSAYPLYGTITTTPNPFSLTEPFTLYLDAKGAERLQVAVGDTITLGSATFIVAGIITADPTALLGGFSLFPKAIISLSDFSQSGLDPNFLRIEYRYAITTDLTTNTITTLDAIDEASNGFIDIDIAGASRTGLQFGLSIVSEFLTIVVLITAVLASVNIYSSSVYLVTVEERSLAILLALGMRRRQLFAMLGASLFYIVIGSFIVGALLTVGILYFITDTVAMRYAIDLPIPSIITFSVIAFGLLSITALGAFTPAVLQLLKRTPRSILLGEGSSTTKKSLYALLLTTICSITPLTLLAYYLLGDIVEAVVSVGAIVTTYIVLALCYQSLLSLVYRRRHLFSFTIKSIISFKKADGLFGVVSFTSLFVALSALCALTLSEAAIENYLESELARTVPTTYVIDIQPSQAPDLRKNFPDLTLFSNIGARIVAIDGIDTSTAIEVGTADRELRREFNITARNELLTSEILTEGTWHAGARGEVSVDSDFAERANINVGSVVEFLIQGVPHITTVTSLRQTDQTSGLPFFFFVIPEIDGADFPATYFGYSFYTPEQQSVLARYVSENSPNISVIETQTLGPLLLTILSTLILLVILVTLPPLLIATLLITTLTTSVYTARRREGARTEALGATKDTVLKNYLLETTALTLTASIAAYGVGLVVTYIVAIRVLDLATMPLYTPNLLYGFILIIGAMTALAYYLFKTDHTPLRALLSYESNR